MIQIKGRVSNFGVVVEDRDEPKDFFTYSPQDVSIQFLNFINIDSIEISFIENYDALFSFVEYVKEFLEIKKSQNLTTNSITLGTQKTKTMTDRMKFKIDPKDNEFIELCKLSNQKLNKDFLLKLYNYLKTNVLHYPKIKENFRTNQYYMIISVPIAIHLKIVISKQFTIFNLNY